MKTKKMLLVLLLVFPMFVNSQDIKPLKNNISVSYGISVPSFTSNPEEDVYASNGSNISFSYAREISTKQSHFIALELKYSKINNPYDNLDSDSKDISNSLPSSLGSWSSSANKYELSSYLLGISYNKYLDKRKKLNLSLKIYGGSGGFVSSKENFQSTSGFFVTLEEAKTNSFVYTTSAGLSIKLTKNIFLGIDAEYFKGSFLIENQVVNIDNQNSSFRDSYIVDYNNITLNTSLNFKF